MHERRHPALALDREPLPPEHALVLTSSPAAVHRFLRGAILLFAVVDRARRVDGIVDGDHFWRQAHVLANVDKMLANGVFATPSTFNADLFLHFYDAPVWQALVAMLSRATGFAPAPLAEAMNVGVFAATFATAWWLTRLLALTDLAGTLALLLLAVSPLSRCYAATSLLDPFVVWLALLSWACWLRADARPGRWAAPIALASGWLATFVKSPVYLPIAATIGIAALREHGWQLWRRPRWLVWIGGLVATLVAFRVLTTVANAGAVGWPDLATELAWYFGDRTERGSWAAHGAILERLGKQVVAWPVLAAAIAGLARRGPTTGERATLRLALTTVATALLFLHVNRVHSYYQLPCVVPLTLVAGAGVAAAWQRLAHSSQHLPRALAIASALAIATYAAFDSQRQLGKLTREDSAPWRIAGGWLAANTDRRDFVLYGTAADDDNPAFLWLAQRDGANVLATAIGSATVARWRERAAATGGRLLAFVPATTPAAIAARRADADWREIASGEPGVIFALTPR